MSEIVGTSSLIIGYGREGRSVHRYLLRHHPELEISIADINEVKRLEGRVSNIFSGSNYLEKIDDFDTVIRSPGIHCDLKELNRYAKSGKKVTSAINIFFAHCPGVTIGITGTKGKSTTASLINQILGSKYSDVRLVGNIGNPVLDHLDGSKKTTLFVVELSSHQLEDCRFSPNIAVLLNIVPEHGDRFNSFRFYVSAKKNLIFYQKSSDVVVYNPSYSVLTSMVRESKAKRYKYSAKKKKKIHCYLDKSNILAKQPFLWKLPQISRNQKRSEKAAEKILAIDKIPLLGPGNLENVLAAVSVGIIFQVPAKKIGQAVIKFKPLPHRLEFVGEFEGIIFYNDSLATIPEATINALEALGFKVETLIAGGYDRGGDFSVLGKYLADTQVKNLILFPETGKDIWQAVCQAIRDKSIRPERYDVSSMEEAIDIAFKKTSKGKICLLSPASASFNLFCDYADRGSQFKKFIRNR